MNKIFHKNNIFKDAQKAWSVYRQAPESFDFPERVTVEITNRCNLSCFMCPRHKVKMETGDMDKTLFRKIVDEIALYLPVSLVPFFRGESLLHPGFLEMMRYAVARGLAPIQMATNAFFLDKKTAKEIIDLGIDFISFSVDTNNPRIYSRIRKNSDFKKISANILYFLDLKTKYAETAPVVQVSAVKTKENSEFIQDFVSFWKDKVDRVRIYYVHSLNSDIGYLQEEKKGLKRLPCLKLLTDIVIYYNGNVAICNHDWQRDTFIGNISRDSIKDIWNNDIYHDIRNKHLNDNLQNFSPCNHCSHWQVYYKNQQIIGELYENKKVPSR